jgi:hypothetical protein
MAVIRSTDHPDLLDVGLNEVYFLYLKETPPEYKSWIDVKSTSLSDETAHKLGEFGNIPQKAEGSLFQFETLVAGSTKVITPLEYGLGYAITRPMRDDDQYGKMVQLTKSLRRSMRNLYETVSYSIFNNSTSTTAKYLGLDGLALLSTAHTNLDGTTWANKPTTDLDISETAVEAGVLNFHARVGESSQPRMVTPKKAVVAGPYQFKAAQIFKNAMRYGTANNDENWIRQGPDANGISEFLASRYITDTGAWFLLGDKDDTTLELHVRVNPEFQVSSDFRTDNHLARAYTRFEAGFHNAHAIYGSTGTS